MFLKKDGSIKKSYIDACYFLINAEIKHHNIIIGGNCILLSDMRDGETVNEYDSYTATCDFEYSNKRKALKDKVSNICNFYNIDPEYKYGLKEWSIDFQNQTDTYEHMKRSLLDLLSR